MPIDFNSTRKVNELTELLQFDDEDLFYVVRFPYTLDTSYFAKFGTIRASLASLIGSGDVVGPVDSTDGDLVLFDGPTGRLIKDSFITPAFLRNRNNHTGQQPFSTISDLPTTRGGYGIVDASPFLTILEEGVPITTAALSFNFTGAGVTASQVDGDVTVDITGSGDMVLSANQTVSGAKTFNDTTLKLFNAPSTFTSTLRTAATSDNNLTIPVSGDDTFVLAGLAQGITGAKTFSDTTLKLFNAAATFATTLKTLASAANNISIPASPDDTLVLVALAQTLTNKTLTSPQLNFGTDANGDIYYRAAGATSRLPVGSIRQNLRVAAGSALEWASPDYRLLGSVVGIDLNAAAPIDLSAITIDATNYIPLYAVVYNVSALASTAQLGIFTAAAGGGVAVVTAAALTNLTAAGKMHVLTLTALNNAPLTAATLIPRLTVAQGNVATADIAIFGIQLPT